MRNVKMRFADCVKIKTPDVGQPIHLKNRTGEIVAKDDNGVVVKFYYGTERIGKAALLKEMSRRR